MYGISLEVAALALYLLPYVQLTNRLNNEIFIVFLTVVKLFIAIMLTIWNFTVVCVWFRYVNPFLQSHRIRWLLIEILCRLISRADQEWIWNGLVVALVVFTGTNYLYLPLW